MRTELSRKAASRQGFTMIELMVALALASIMFVMISAVSSQAKLTYTRTVSKVELYNAFRFAFNTLQQDLKRWIPTQELEFYNDGRGGRSRDFHWQPGEEVPDRRDDLGWGVVDGGIRDEYEEYAFIEERQYRSIEKSQLLLGDSEPKPHDAYRVYFKTMTYVDGAVREANVEYRLVDTSRPTSEWENGVPPFPSQRVEPSSVPDLALYKIVRYYEISDKTIQQIVQYPIERRVLELATNVTDFRVEYLVHNPFANEYNLHSEFRIPSEDFRRPVEQATRPVKETEKVSPSSGEPATAERTVYRKYFGYGSMRIGQGYPVATAFPAVWGDNQLRSNVGEPRPVRVGFQMQPTVISFAELAAGDRIFVFTDSQGGQAQNQSAGGAVNVNELTRFPSGDYTVKANLQGMLEVVEDIDSSTWGDREQRPIFYKAAFVPSALRLTLRMVDDEGLNPKTMQQVIWLRRKSR